MAALQLSFAGWAYANREKQNPKTVKKDLIDFIRVLVGYQLIGSKINHTKKSIFTQMGDFWDKKNPAISSRTCRERGLVYCIVTVLVTTLSFTKYIVFPEKS